MAVDALLQPDRTNQPRGEESVGTEFLDNVAHQMIAPLQSIEMHCYNLIDGTMPRDREKDRLKEIVGHGKILAELARRLRFLHELVSGKVIDTEELEFHQIATAWIDCFNNYLPATKETGMSIDIDTVRMNSLSPVIASRLAVQQVMMNLYDNAIKYGKRESTIRVRVRKQGTAIINEFSHAARVRLTPEAAARIGERGFRAEEAKQLRASGTGIGMWISKKLMLAMQGDLVAEPTDRAGVTRFKLYWRLAQ